MAGFPLIKKKKENYFDDLLTISIFKVTLKRVNIPISISLLEFYSKLIYKNK